MLNGTALDRAAYHPISRRGLFPRRPFSIRTGQPGAGGAEEAEGEEDQSPSGAVDGTPVPAGAMAAGVFGNIGRGAFGTMGAGLAGLPRPLPAGAAQPPAMNAGAGGSVGAAPSTGGGAGPAAGVEGWLEDATARRAAGGSMNGAQMNAEAAQARLDAERPLIAAQAAQANQQARRMAHVSEADWRGQEKTDAFFNEARARRDAENARVNGFATLSRPPQPTPPQSIAGSAPAPRTNPVLPQRLAQSALRTGALSGQGDRLGARAATPVEQDWLAAPDQSTDDLLADPARPAPPIRRPRPGTLAGLPRTPRAGASAWSMV